MPKTGLEKAIDEAVSNFTVFVLEAVRDMPLEELSELRGEDLIVRPEQVEVAPPKEDQDRAPVTKPLPATVAKKKTHPNCAYPGRTKNRFVRGHGYCGRHWKKWKRGEIADAETCLETQP